VKGEETAETDFGGAVAVASLMEGEEEDAKLEDIKQRQVCLRVPDKPVNSRF
jgi:hypothetical protein